MNCDLEEEIRTSVSWLKAGCIITKMTCRVTCSLSNVHTEGEEKHKVVFRVGPNCRWKKLNVSFSQVFIASRKSERKFVDITDSTEQCPWEANSHSASQEIPCYYGIQRFIMCL
jgi:hypothetical protein